MQQLDPPLQEPDTRIGTETHFWDSKGQFVNKLLISTMFIVVISFKPEFISNFLKYDSMNIPVG